LRGLGGHQAALGRVARAAIRKKRSSVSKR
jgi:hypothetical protein